MTYSIVIANRYPDIIAPLLESIENKIPDKPHIIIVMDGHENDYGYKGVRYDEEHFAYAHAANLGIEAAGGGDIILINDDCRLLEFNFFARLRDLAYHDPLCGIMSPLIMGCVGGQGVQRYWERDIWWKYGQYFIAVEDPYPVCFPCVYLKEKMLLQIGLLNEEIAGYGFDDDDLCRRARHAGWKTMVTQNLIVQHADGSAELGTGKGKSWASSFMRRWPGSGFPSNQDVKKYLERMKGY